MPPGPLGSPRFMAFEPCSPKWGKAEAGEGCYQDGGWNKSRIQAGGGPEVSRVPFRLTYAKANFVEDGPPPQEPSNQRRSSGEQQDKLARERSLIRQLETNLQHREEALRRQQAGAREGPESSAGGGCELKGAFPGPYLRKDNRQPKAHRDRRIGEGSRSQGKIHSRQQERGKEWGDLDEEGRRTELRQAIGALQIEDPGREKQEEGSYNPGQESQ